MTFSNNPEKLSLFGGGCNGSATFSELFRLVLGTSGQNFFFEFAHKKFSGEKFNSLERKWGVIYEFLIKNDRDIACQSFGVGRFFLQLPWLLDRFQVSLLHRSSGARRRLGGQKATFLCRLDGVLTDLCSSSWMFSSEWRFCAAFSGSKWAGVFFWKSVGCGKRFLQLFLDRTSRFFTGLKPLCRSSSGHERYDIWKPNHHYHFYARPWWAWSCFTVLE